MSSEWPLLIFTILMQISIGLALSVALRESLVGAQLGSGAFEAGDWQRKAPSGLTAMLVSLVVAVLGLGVSFLHLRNPLHSIYAISNIFHSWMSREIFFSVGFLLLLAVAVALGFRGKGKAARVALWVTVAESVVLLCCMAGAYMTDAQPAWNTIATLFGFFGAALAAGTGLGATILASHSDIAGRVLVLTSAGGGLLLLASMVVRLAILGGSGASAAARASFALIAGDFLPLAAASAVLAVAGCACALIAGLGSRKLSAGSFRCLCAASVACFLIAAVLDRAVFYFTCVPIYG